MQEPSLVSTEAILADEAISLLMQLINTPSLSKEEDKTAAIVAAYLSSKNIPVKRMLNNVWVTNKHFDPAKPTLLLNSHHDTVKPNSGYTKNPFHAHIEAGKLYGLGSNDAGGALVALLAAFLHFYAKPDLKYNIIYAATAEEEISGHQGIEALLPDLGKIDLAIVGEPTQMHLAVAEKGLLVIDCICQGRAGHAAREEGENAIYKAMKDMEWFRTYQFPKVSPTLGAVKMSLTIINAGSQHNVVPDTCTFTVDIRVTDCYTHDEVLNIIKENISCEVVPRSTRLKSSSIPVTHPLVQAGIKLGRSTYGSPTCSDQALIPVPSFKMGPGDSARSHTANEYIYVNEVKDGVDLYIRLLEEVIR